MESFIQAGDHAQLQNIFTEPQYRKYMHLNEYKVIADIDYLEQRALSNKRLWPPGRNDILMLLSKIRKLKHMIKRIEYNAAPTDQTMQQITTYYSVYAIIVIFQQYVERRQLVYEKLRQYFQKNQQSALEVWEKLPREIL